jgi:hypothetical protein
MGGRMALVQCGDNLGYRFTTHFLPLGESWKVP